MIFYVEGQAVDDGYAARNEGVGIIATFCFDVASRFPGEAYSAAGAVDVHLGMCNLLAGRQTIDEAGISFGKNVTIFTCAGW